MAAPDRNERLTAALRLVVAAAGLAIFFADPSEHPARRPFVNVALALFNMLPALPMDGGRVFRALLAMLLGKLPATVIAATVGQLMAAGLALFGLFQGNVILALIGAFVFFGASQERAAARAAQTLSGLGAGQVVDPRAIVLSPGDLLGVALHHAVRAPQTHFAVVHGDRVIGTLSREEMLRHLHTLGPLTYVAGVMQRELAEVDATMPLSEVRLRLLELGGRPVVVNGPYGYLGLIGIEDLARAAMMATALRVRAASRTPVPSRDSLF